jgi:two-component system, sensor histidine kinase and response regulator
MNTENTPVEMSKQLLSLAIDSMPLCMVVVDSNGKIVLASRETELLFHYDRDELLRKDASVLLSRSAQEGHRLGEGSFADPKARRSGRFVCDAQRKDGSTFPIQMDFKPINTAEGSFLLGAIVDLSEHDKALEATARAQQLVASNLASEAEKARRTAQQVEERLNLALKSSEVGTWSWNISEDSIIWDDYIHPLYGLKPGTFPGRYEAFEKMLHPNDRQRVTQEVRNTIEHDAPFDTEFQVIWPDGSIHILGSRGKVYRDVEGKPLRMTGVCWDITDRKRSELALAAANAQLAGVLAAATQISIIATNVDGLVTVFNSGAQNLLGYTADEIVGKYTPSILHVAEEVTVRGSELTAELGYPVAGFEVFVAYAKRGRFDRREWTYVRKDGSRFPVSLVVTAVKNDSGEITGFLGIAEDITERKRMVNRLRAIVDAAPTAILVVNSLGDISLANNQAEEIFGYPRAELIGQKVEFLLPERFRKKHVVHRQEFFIHPVQRDMGTALELYGLRKDGAEFPLKVGLSPIDTDDGTAVICGVFDTTHERLMIENLRTAKEAAESASRAKSSFLANMSHEIRTPMNGIIGMSQLLAQTELRSNQREYLATVEESAHILLRLLNDILDFSKIEAGKLELELVNFRLSECVARASQLLALKASEKGLEVACRLAPEMPDNLRGDPGRIQQVLVNLLGNAVKFTEAGEIFVNVNPESIDQDKVRLHFTVSDTGLGIAPDKLDQIFRPFEQAESSTTRRFGGTGLGLTISKQLVEMMNGRMWVDSEPGRGSTFHFTAEFAVAPDQRTHEPAELSALKDMPVLVVDDNLTNRRILEEMLRHWRMRPMLADSASTAREALQKAARNQQPIRLILLDHHMPGEDGFHFADSLMKTSGDQCPIIMISSGTTPLDAEQCARHGIGRFMTKPVIGSELLDEVLRQFGRPAALATEQPRATSQSEAVSPRRVLLVEDNEINRRVALGLLRKRGHHPEVAENGQEALNLLTTQEFDVVLMDMQMPVMDGYEATTAIRQREHHTGGHIPIVAMTAEALKGDRERFLAAGMDDYVSKPIIQSEMYRAIERFPALCLPVDVSGPQAFPSQSSTRNDQTETRVDTVAAEPRLPTAGEAQTADPVVDWQVARKLLAEGSMTLAELAALVKEEAPKLLDNICCALESGDAKTLRRSAHTLKSSANYFGAKAVVHVAQAIEDFAVAQSLERIPELLTGLKRAVTRFLDALDHTPE